MAAGSVVTADVPAAHASWRACRRATLRTLHMSAGRLARALAVRRGGRRRRARVRARAALRASPVLPRPVPLLLPAAPLRPRRAPVGQRSASGTRSCTRASRSPCRRSSTRSISSSCCARTRRASRSLLALHVPLAALSDDGPGPQGPRPVADRRRGRGARLRARRLRALDRELLRLRAGAWPGRRPRSSVSSARHAATGAPSPRGGRGGDPDRSRPPARRSSPRRWSSASRSSPPCGRGALGRVAWPRACSAPASPRRCWS